MTLIALCSPAPGSGKSTVAAHLVEHHGFVRVKFADPLKNMMRSLLRDANMSDATIERYVDGDWKELEVPVLGVTSRWAQQSLGTDWGRTCIRADLWSSVVETKVRALAAQGQKVVIDDMRFPNELEAVHRLGGLPVRITRPGFVRQTDHPSEGGLDDVAMFELLNNGSVDDLRSAADRAILGAL